ncbi:hypothetical protein ACHBJW_001537 [Klebsiella aerogenes]|nr:hypothetical protein [Klebsiella aerogenes]HDU5042154.1 hypothetical protein [Klebsiella aerogenes]
MTMIPLQMVHVAAVALLTLALAGIDWDSKDKAASAAFITYHSLFDHMKYSPIKE